MAELEYKGGLYVDEEKRPIMPASGIEAMIVAGAKKSKEGQIAKASVYCPKASLLKYKGPQEADSLWKDDNFRITTGVKVQKSRIMRTRPYFPEWSVDIELCYNVEMCNSEQIFQWLKACGEQCGAFDWRPKYGRFTVERLK